MQPFRDLPGTKGRWDKKKKDRTRVESWHVSWTLAFTLTHGLCKHGHRWPTLSGIVQKKIDRLRYERLTVPNCR